jgi:hypothetical protein
MCGAFLHQGFDAEDDDWPDLVRNDARETSAAGALALPVVDLYYGKFEAPRR